MSRKVSPALVGAFVLGAIVLGVAFLVVFGGGILSTGRARTYVMCFDSSLKGLKIGAPVEFRGVRIGSVKDIKLTADVENLTFNVPVYIVIEARQITNVREGKQVKEQLKGEGWQQTIDLLVKRGLKAQLQPESFLTGQLLVALDFRPDKPIKLTGVDREYPEIPTIPSEMEMLTQRIEELPIENLVSSAQETFDSVGRLSRSSELLGTIRSVEATLKDVQKLTQRLSKDGPAVSQEITASLKEVSAAARSVRSMADYIERHPESLLYGKGRE